MVILFLMEAMLTRDVHKSTSLVTRSGNSSSPFHIGIPRSHSYSDASVRTAATFAMSFFIAYRICTAALHEAVEMIIP